MVVLHCVFGDFHTARTPLPRVVVALGTMQSAQASLLIYNSKSDGSNLVLAHSSYLVTLAPVGTGENDNMIWHALIYDGPRAHKKLSIAQIH